MWRSVCCAGTTAGHVAAAPPTRLRNSRRLIPKPPQSEPIVAVFRGGLEGPAMSAWVQTRSSFNRSLSGLHEQGEPSLRSAIVAYREEAKYVSSGDAVPLRAFVPRPPSECRPSLPPLVATSSKLMTQSLAQLRPGRPAASPGTWPLEPSGI